MHGNQILHNGPPDERKNFTGSITTPLALDINFCDANENKRSDCGTSLTVLTFLLVQFSNAVYSYYGVLDMQITKLYRIVPMPNVFNLKKCSL